MKHGIFVLLLAVHGALVAQVPTNVRTTPITPNSASSENQRKSSALNGVKDVGGLTIMLFDAEEWGQPGVFGRVSLYDSTSALVGQGSTNASSTVTFSDVVSASGYYYRAYSSEPSAWGDEFWGEKTGISIAPGQITNETLKHNTPYMPEVRVYLDANNELLPDGGKRIVEPGTLLRVELEIKNPEYEGAQTVSAFGGLYLDRDKIAPYDVYMTLTPQSYTPGTTRNVVFTCPAPSISGDYYLSVGAFAWSNRYATTLTDGSGWRDPAFTVYVPPVPVVTSLGPLKGKAGTVVTIEGENFSTEPTENIVYFGPVRASVTAASASALQVVAPPGSGSNSVTVTVDGLTARSPMPYDLTYEGGGRITTSLFDAKVELPAVALLRQGTVADLDGDGKPDLAESSDNGMVSIYRNISSPGDITTASFAARLDFAVGSRPYQLQKGDIDGDGKLDLVNANNSGGSFTVLRNSSSPGSMSFARKDISALGYPQCLAIGDLDGDGRQDVAITGAAPTGVVVFRNTSMVGTVSFAVGIPLNTGRGCNGIAMADIDGDGKSDLIVANGINFGGEVGSLTVFRNLSSAGGIQFESGVHFPCGQFARAIAIADLDGDQKLDVIMSVGTDSYAPEKLISLFRNTSASGVVSFATRIDLQSGTPWFVDVGDLNGDGKVDIAAPSQTTSSISVFENFSAPGVLSFGSRVDFPTRGDPFSVNVVDLDGDGKPDLSAASYSGMGVSVLRSTGHTIPALPPWQFTNTGASHTIIIPLGTPVSVDGEVVTAGDYIGVFYDSSGTPACGGYERWRGDEGIAISAFGDDLTTAAKDGFSPEEPFQWKVFRASEGTVHIAEASYAPIGGVVTHTGSYATNGISQIESLVGPAASHALSLRAGWSMISSYVVPQSVALDSLFAPVLLDLIIVKNGAQQTYIPSVPVNTIGAWSETEGYQIKMVSAKTLNVMGQRIVASTLPIDLPAGWSIMPYVRGSEMSVASALSGIADDVIIVKDQDGKTYIPSVAVNGIGTLKVGQGYQIKLEAAQTLLFPAGKGSAIEGPSGTASSKDAMRPANGPPWYYTNTGTNHTCIIPLAATPVVDGTPISAGDYVGAFYDSGGIPACAGYEAWTGDSNISVALFGDDATTGEKEGFATGEVVQWRIWRASENHVYRAEPTYTPSGGLGGIVSDTGAFTPNGISALSGLSGNLTNVPRPDEPVSYMLLQNYPNPFNPSTRIGYSLASHGNVTLKVLNTVGQIVAVLVDRVQDAGYHEIEFNAGQLSSGVYLYQLRAGEFFQVRKLTLLK